MDELAEINGMKPNVLLADCEEREVGSATSKSKYKVKRTLDHYHCTCPAWRNQAGVPVNARTCKHLKAFLGDEYEIARILLKNPDGPPPKGGKAAAKPKATKAAAASTRTKPASKRKRVDDEQDDDAGAEAKPASKKAAGRTSKRTKVEQPVEDAEMKPVVEEETATPGEGADELAEINGIKPLAVLHDGQETEIGSATSKSKYKIKRTFDHYYCSCPAWRNQARVPVNARTCKHLKSFLGEAYEEARIQLKTSGTGEETAPSGTASKTKAKAKAKAKPASSKAKFESKAAEESESRSDTPKVDIRAPDGDVDMDRDRDQAQSAKDEPGDQGKQSKVISADANEDVGASEPLPAIPAADGSTEQEDELAEIDGVKPDVYMKDGDEREVGSLARYMTGLRSPFFPNFMMLFFFVFVYSNSKYKIKRTWDHYYCSCPAWRNQSGAPVNARTCKHLKNLLGDAYETARLLKKNPDGPQPGPTPKKSRAKGKGTAKAANEEEGGGGEGAVPELLLANKWDLDDGLDPVGWWASEKLDGVRTYYDGTRMISRLGNPFTPPQWFLDKLPKDVTLDGELFSGRGEFQSTVSIVKTVNSPHWKNITFQVFDVPSRGNELFESRLEFLHTLFGPGGSHCSEYVNVVVQEKVRDRQHVLDKLREIEGVGGEGLMLRQPNSLYEGNRSSTLLKVKTFYDAEAVVTGYVNGKGKNKGVTGALQCKMESGKTFSVGSGLTDKQRKNPPSIGSIIVYRFQELTRDRVPRFPTFVGIAADKEKPKDAEIPEHKLQSALSKGDA